MNEYIFSNANKFKVKDYPFEHLYIENFLPPDFYDELKKDINNLSWWLDDEKVNQSEDWNRYTMCLFYKDDYVRRETICKYNKIFQNEQLQDFFLKKFTHKRSENLPKCLHIQIDSLKCGMEHALHCDKLPKLLTFVHYLADDNSHSEIGTRIFNKQKEFVKTTEFKRNSVLIFAPSNDDEVKTWHSMQLNIPDFERIAIQTWFLYDKYKKPPLPFEGFKWTKDESHLKKRKKRYRRYRKYLSKFAY